MMEDTLKQFGLAHLLEGVDSLTPFKRDFFFSELKKYGTNLFEKQLRALDEREKIDLGKPVCLDREMFDTREESEGLSLLKKGKIACLLLAGGQGTRLGVEGPKGLFPITNIFEKPLFRLFFEKVSAACGLAHRSLKIAILTSPHNHRETVKYLQEQHYFGICQKDVEFYMQSELPMLSREKKWFLESPGKLATAPDGNGVALIELIASGIADKWRKEGIEYVNVVPIDNPLADPFDFSMIGHQAKKKSDLCIKGIAKNHAKENLGVIAKEREAIRVIEYSELSPSEALRVDDAGKLYWNIAYSGLFSFHLDFLNIEMPEMPWHIAEKKAGAIDVYKFETFIFDAFPYAKNPEVILASRGDCFAPLKQLEDVELVKKALASFDKKIFSKVTGLPPPQKIFELDPTFYYPTDTLLQDWKGKSLPEDEYIYP